MAEFNYTPGPWPIDTVPTSVGSCHKIGNFPTNVVGISRCACLYVDGQYGDEKSEAEFIAKANAHLIAAAPEMYEALKEIAAVTAYDGPSAVFAWEKRGQIAREQLAKIEAC